MVQQTVMVLVVIMQALSIFQTAHCGIRTDKILVLVALGTFSTPQILTQKDFV
jgi:hypothetical protein